MTGPPGSDKSTFILLEAARRRVWILFVCALVGAAAAYFIAHSQPKRYTAVASLLFQQSALSQELFGFSESVADNSTTEQATDISLSSEPVISEITSRAVQGTTYEQVKNAVSVTAANVGEVISVSATTSSAELSVRIANRYADAVIAYQQQAQRAQVEQAAASLTAQIGKLPAGSTELKTLSARLNQLNALASLETGDVQIAGQALKPTGPSSPKPKRDAFLGLIIGLLAGLAGGFVLERRDRRIRTVEEAASAVAGLPILGEIPSLTRGQAVATVGNGSHGFDEAFRFLRAQLRYFSVDSRLKSVLVTSPSPADGKSTVAWNLALTSALSSPDARVLLVDADLRRPRVATVAQIANVPGLAEVLSEDAAFDDALQTVPISIDNSESPETKLWVLPAGGTPPNPSQLLESTAFSTLLQRITEEFDFVIIDSSPISVVSDSIPLVQQVSGVLIVLRILHTQRGAVEALRAQLDQLGARLLGAAVNGVVSSGKGYGGYDRYYGYSEAATGSDQAV
jgi:capsular exopolysaccharide synthesis family protein